MTENILEEANRITSQDRRKEYGPASLEFERAANVWSSLLQRKLKDGMTLSAEDYAMCMIAVKLIRYSYKSGRDSLVDIAGYARTIEMLTEETTEQFFDRHHRNARMVPFEEIGATSELAELGREVLKPKCGDQCPDQFFQRQYEKIKTPSVRPEDMVASHEIDEQCPACKNCLCEKCVNYHLSKCIFARELIERVTGKPWDLPLLQKIVLKDSTILVKSSNPIADVFTYYEGSIKIPPSSAAGGGGGSATVLVCGDSEQEAAETYQKVQEEAKQRYQQYIDQSASATIRLSPGFNIPEIVDRYRLTEADAPHQVPVDEAAVAQVFIHGSDEVGDDDHLVQLRRDLE